MLAETDDGDIIRVFLWEDGINSETIQDINNWDTVRNHKIALYNEYRDALDTFGFTDTSLAVLYVSPEEEISFLTIQDGEIVYDVFDEAA